MKTKRPQQSVNAKAAWTPIAVNLTPREIDLTNSKLVEVAQGIGIMREKLSPPQWEITQKIGLIYRAIRDHIEDYDSYRTGLLDQYAVRVDGEIQRDEQGNFKLLQPDYRIAESELLRKPVTVKLPLWTWSELAWLHGTTVDNVSVESIVISPLAHIISEEQ